MLLNSFNGKPGERKVRNRRYHIMNSKSNEVINLNEWNDLIRPGSQLEMSMILSMTSTTGKRCPRPSCSGPLVNDTATGELARWLVISFAILSTISS
jgi:hypothetical protein